MNILDIFKKRKNNDELSSDVANSVSSGITPIPNQPMPIAPDGVTAVRPRIVPNMPVNEDTGYSESAPMNVYPTPSQTTQDEINDVQTRAYNPGRYRNPQTGDITNNPHKQGYTEMITAPGKDRDQRWSLRDKIGSTLLGVLSGAGGGPLGMLAGGLNAGMNRNFLEQRDDSQELNRLIPRLKEQQQAEGFQQKQEAGAVNIDNAKLKPGFEQQKLDNQLLRIQNQDLASQRTYNRLVAKEQRIAEQTGNKTQVKEVNGRLFKVYTNDPNKGMEPIIDPTTGQQAINPVNVAKPVTLNDGRQVWVRDGQIYSSEQAAQRQEDAQEFRAGQQQTTSQQKELDRAQRLRLTLAKQKMSKAQLTIRLKDKVASGEMTQDEANAVLKDADGQ